jgi:hypothetical protein
MPQHAGTASDARQRDRRGDAHFEAMRTFMRVPGWEHGYQTRTRLHGCACIRSPGRDPADPPPAIAAVG